MATSISARVSQEDLDSGTKHVRVAVFAGPDEDHRASVGYLFCLKDEALDIADRLNRKD